MKIVFMYGGLGNQVLAYIFARYLEESTKQTVYIDDSLFHMVNVQKTHDGYVNRTRIDDVMCDCRYELEYVFPNIKKPRLLSQHYSAAEWNGMIANALADDSPTTSIARQLGDGGLPNMKFVFEAGFGTAVLKDNKIIGSDTKAAESFLCRDVFFTPFLRFNSRVSQLSGNVYYHGLWLSTGYFNAFRSILSAELAFPRLEDAVNKQYADKINNCFSIGLHLRRRAFTQTGWGLSNQYYSDVVSGLRETRLNSTFFVFSDDMEWCKENITQLGLRADSTVFVEGDYGESLGTAITPINNLDFVNNYIDMQLMSMCNILVTTSTSTFGFVASLLAKKNDFKGIHSIYVPDVDVVDSYAVLLRELKHLPQDTVFYGAGQNMTGILDGYGFLGISFVYEIWDANADKIGCIKGHKVCAPDDRTKISNHRSMVITLFDSSAVKTLAEKYEALGWNVLNAKAEYITINRFIMHMALSEDLPVCSE